MNRIYKVIYSKAKHCYIVASEIAKSHGKSGGSGGMKKLLIATLAVAALSCTGFVNVASAADQTVNGKFEVNVSEDQNVTNHKVKANGVKTTVTAGDKNRAVSKVNVDEIVNKVVDGDGKGVSEVTADKIVNKMINSDDVIVARVRVEQNGNASILATDTLSNYVKDENNDVVASTEMDKEGHIITTAKTSVKTEVGNASFMVENGSITDRITEGDKNQNTSTSTAIDNHRYMTNGTQASYIGQQANGIGTIILDDATGAKTSTEQYADNITSTAKAGTIKNDAKNLVNNATEAITNTAKDIINEVSDSVTTTVKVGTEEMSKMEMDKDGNITATAKTKIKTAVGNTSFTVEDGSITDRITEGDADQNTSTSTATQSHRFMTNGTQSSVTMQTADDIAQLITEGEAFNKVESTVASGTTFINTNANTLITENGKTGIATETNIKGNTISTGKATMDFAEVLNDLGVRGDATIDGKTKTGSLEVTGESNLKGNTTIGTAESNADLTVYGNSTVTGNSKVGGTLDVTGNATFHNNVEAKSYTVTGTGIVLDETGLDMDDHKITGVADGEMSATSTDAVNGRQLYTVKRDLETQIDKVGANAAAMANLKPLDFDADSKWNLAGAIGNYGSETAAALGVFYRPNEDVMLNVSTAFGTGENMYGGGVSIRLGKGGHSKRVTRAENEALKAQVESLTARMDALLSVLNPNMSKEFPDVPENHWAYEAVSRLAGNGLVEGYPDGEFHGDRTMSRYEMAEIIYNALSQGAQAEKDLVEEFKPELQAMAASQKVSK